MKEFIKKYILDVLAVSIIWALIIFSRNQTEELKIISLEWVLYLVFICIAVILININRDK